MGSAPVGSVYLPVHERLLTLLDSSDSVWAEFVVAGCDDDPVFSDALSKLRGTFHWRTNEDNFTWTGIEIETLQDGGFHLRQQRFVDQLELMSLSQRLSRADTDKLTPDELTRPSRSVWFCELVGEPNSS